MISFWNDDIHNNTFSYVVIKMFGYFSFIKVAKKFSDKKKLGLVNSECSSKNNSTREINRIGTRGLVSAAN